MSNGEIVADSGDYSENGEALAMDLPPFLPSGRGSGNFKTLDVVGRAFDRLDDDIRDVDEAATVQTANTISEIAELANMVESRPKSGEQKEKYRTRVIARFQQTTGEGTIKNLLQNTATLLGIAVTQIGYDEYDYESGAVQIQIPKSALDSLGLSENEFVTIASSQLGAGFSLVAQFRGTFEYKSVGDTDDPNKGFGGLDVNNEPDGTGGTYAGLITR